MLDRIEEKPMNTPVREFEKFLSMFETIVVRLKHNKFELREGFSGAQSSEAGQQKRKREGNDTGAEKAFNK